MKSKQAGILFFKVWPQVAGTPAITMRLWTECFPVAGGLIGTETSLRWPKPTRPGDLIHVEVEITAIIPSRTKNDRGIVTYVTQAYNQFQDLLLISTTKIVVFKKAAIEN